MDGVYELYRVLPGAYRWDVRQLIFSIMQREARPGTASKLTTPTIESQS